MDNKPLYIQISEGLTELQRISFQEGQAVSEGMHCLANQSRIENRELRLKILKMIRQYGKEGGK